MNLVFWLLDWRLAKMIDFISCVFNRVTRPIMEETMLQRDSSEDSVALKRFGMISKRFWESYDECSMICFNEFSIKYCPSEALLIAAITWGSTFSRFPIAIPPRAMEAAVRITSELDLLLTIFWTSARIFPLSQRLVSLPTSPRTFKAICLRKMSSFSLLAISKMELTKGIFSANEAGEIIAAIVLDMEPTDSF